jgi:putative tricarboxylic transport membrane protein
MMADRVILACTLVVAAIYLYATTLIPSLEIGDPLGPKAFPRLLGIGLLIAASLLGLEMWKDRHEREPAAPAAPRDMRIVWMLGAVVLWTGLYYAFLQSLGYIVDSSIYLFALMSWFNRGKWIANGVTAVLYSAVSYILFVKLDVNLPRGVEAVSWISDALITVTNAVIVPIKALYGILG